MSFVADLVALIATSPDGRLSCPPGCARVQLGSLCEIVNGFPFASKGFGSVGSPVVRIRDVTRGSTSTRFEGPVPSGFWVKRGDLLVGMDGNFCAATWQSDDALLNQRVCKIVPDTRKIDADYLRFVLPAYLECINENTPSVTVKHLSSRTLASIPLPLPHIGMQQRVASRIRELFVDLDDGEALLARARDDLGTWRKALLKAAVTGELTADWRATNLQAETGADLLARILDERRRDGAKDKSKYTEPKSLRRQELSELPHGWTWATIEQLCAATRPVAYGVLQPGADVTGGTALVRVMDIADGRVAISQLKKINHQIARQYPRTELRGGEVLLTVVGSIGRTALVPEELAGANTARAVAVLAIKYASAEWVELCLRFEPYRAALENSAHEVARKTLNLEDVRAFPIPVPPLAEQSELVRLAKSEIQFGSDMQAAMIDAGEAASALRRSILAAAFRGDLAR